MSRVFLYSRVSTDQQTLAQQERTVYEWLNAHQMKVDRIVSDEGVSGGVSYADRCSRMSFFCEANSSGLN